MVRRTRLVVWRWLLSSTTEPNEFVSLDLSRIGVVLVVRTLADKVRSKDPLLV